MKLYSTNLKLPIIIYGSLASISTEIDSEDFIQVHRSYIINTREINSITYKSLTMSNAVIIPVGRKYQILLDGFFK